MARLTVEWWLLVAVFYWPARPWEEVSMLTTALRISTAPSSVATQEQSTRVSGYQTTTTPRPSDSRTALSVSSYVAIAMSAFIVLLLFVFIFGTTSSKRRRRRRRRRRRVSSEQTEAMPAPQCDSRLAITEHPDGPSDSSVGQNGSYENEPPPPYEEAIRLPAVSTTSLNRVDNPREENEILQYGTSMPEQ